MLQVVNCIPKKFYKIGQIKKGERNRSKGFSSSAKISFFPAESKDHIYKPFLTPCWDC